MSSRLDLASSFSKALRKQSLAHGSGTKIELLLGMQGRITEIHLDEAEKTFPGISLLYQGLVKKPLTFLQLVYLYEVTLAG